LSTNTEIKHDAASSTVEFVLFTRQSIIAPIVDLGWVLMNPHQSTAKSNWIEQQQ